MFDRARCARIAQRYELLDAQRRRPRPACVLGAQDSLAKHSHVGIEADETPLAVALDRIRDHLGA